MDYDIAVAGAGPAGSTAAYILSKKGYNVLLIDKENFPRKKLCGGCLTLKTLQLLNEIFNEPEHALTQKNIIDFKSHRFEIRYKTEILVNKPSAYPFYFVDRSIYDDFLFQKAKKAGTNVIPGEKITGVNSEKNELITVNNRLIKAKFIIAADGANSTLRAKLLRQKKLKAPFWQRNMAYCLETFPGRNQYASAIDYPILSFGYLRYGYAWIFPNKERVVVGMGGLNRKNKHLTGKFNTFLSDYHLNTLDSLETRGHPLPFGSFIPKPLCPGGNILLIGDAAGLVDPILGEGIYQAQKSGELAAQAIIEKFENNKDPESNFLNLLRTHLLHEIIYARKYRWFLYNNINHILKYRSIKWAATFFDKLVELGHGDRSYQRLKKK